MEAQCLKEYELVREEMLSLKECMTSYVGYVLGGSGIALFGLASFGTSQAGLASIAITSLILSLLVSLILLILFYKFNSHNRFAGYCKLLSHETFQLPPLKSDTQLFSWEICVERLRHAEVEPEVLQKLAGLRTYDEPSEEGLKLMLERYAGRSAKVSMDYEPPVDTDSFWHGLRRLFLAVIGDSKTDSWGFPPYIVAVFFVLCAGFLGLGLYCSVRILILSTTASYERFVPLIVAIMIVVTEVLLWILFCRRLHSLMIGSTTVDAFFWRFLPIRAHFLSAHDIRPKYVNTNERIREAESQHKRR